MLERIDVFMPPATRYGMLAHLTKSLFDALQRQGIRCRLLVAQHNNPEPFLDSLFSDPPECTLSFNGLLPDAKGNFFCNMIKIPHVAYLLTSPYEYLPLTKSPLNIIVSSDLFACHFFLGLNFEQTIFLPPAVEKSIAKGHALKKIYDVVMLATYIDYEGIRAIWKKNILPNFAIFWIMLSRSVSLILTHL